MPTFSAISSWVNSARYNCQREEMADAGVPALAGIRAKEPPKGVTPTANSSRGQYTTASARHRRSASALPVHRFWAWSHSRLESGPNRPKLSLHC